MLMSDKYLLKAMMNRQRFLSLHKSVPRDMFSSITLRVLDSYADYYQKYPEHDEIDVEALSTLIKLKKNQSSEETFVINRVLDGLRDAHKINDIISIKPENLSKDGLIDLIKQDDMTLRDYFAAKALQGICASGPSS